MQGWREIEHTTIILVHSNELHAVSPNLRWNPLNKRIKHTYTATVLEPYKKLGTLAAKHHSSTHTLQKDYQEEITTTFYKKLKYETNTPDRECINLP